MIQSDLLKEIHPIQHGFGDLNEPVPAHLKESWDTNQPIWKQTHGLEISVITDKRQESGEVDGFVTSQKNLPIGIRTADCVPILLAHSNGTSVAAIHAGWRGTFHGILYSFKRLSDSLGFRLEEWVAAIGPCIRSCCFEVSLELQKDFVKNFAQFESNQVAPSFRKIDLQYVNAMILREIGIPKVDLLPHCTYCEISENGNHRFHSYRREASKVRQYSVISLSFQ